MNDTLEGERQRGSLTYRALTPMRVTGQSLAIRNECVAEDCFASSSYTTIADMRAPLGGFSSEQAVSIIYCNKRCFLTHPAIILQNQARFLYRKLTSAHMRNGMKKAGLFSKRRRSRTGNPSQERGRVRLCFSSSSSRNLFFPRPLARLCKRFRGRCPSSRRRF